MTSTRNQSGVIRVPLRKKGFSCSQKHPDLESRLTFQEKGVLGCRRHRNAVIDGDRIEPLGNAICLLDLVRNQMSEVLEMDVTSTIWVSRSDQLSCLNARLHSRKQARRAGNDRRSELRQANLAKDAESWWCGYVLNGQTRRAHAGRSRLQDASPAPSVQSPHAAGGGRPCLLRQRRFGAKQRLWAAA